MTCDWGASAEAFFLSLYVLGDHGRARKGGRGQNKTGGAALLPPLSLLGVYESV
ncbi:hypothetical protein CSUI_008286, partial [Cystoisospora suis]